MKEEKVFFTSSNGIRLEGLLSIHETLSFVRGAIFCHPHPQYGGDMYNPVITSAVEAASQEGFSTFRFNFRGVGESSGTYGEGIGEREDVKATIDYFYSKLRKSKILLILTGYSFGIWAGFPIAIRDERIQGMVGIAPPLEVYDFGFLKGCKKKKFFIVGSHDSLCPVSLFKIWYSELEEPKSLAIINRADHFFFSHHRSLLKPLRDFFKTF